MKYVSGWRRCVCVFYLNVTFLQFFFIFCAVVLAVTHAKRVENQVQFPAASERLERHAHHDDHHGHHNAEVVDFGAHTGEKGSFGWYADFPVITDH